MSVSSSLERRNSPRRKEKQPPQSLEALRNLVLLIKREQAGISLGAKAIAVLARLVEAPEQTAVRTISELAALHSVNASTLTRLAQKLGYTGFNELQYIFREAVAGSGGSFYSRQAGRLLSSDHETSEDLAVFEKLARETAANVDGFLSQLDADSVEQAASLLARGRRVRVHGVRQFHALASFLTYGLSMLRSDVSLLDAPRLGIAEALAQMENGDIVVVASCAPYTAEVAAVAAISAALGLEVIAVTDSRASPLVPPSKLAFFIPHASSFFSNSMGAYIVFCEGLLNVVARKLGNRAINALAQREKLIADLQIETS